MNIFRVDEDPVKSAQMLCDKHIVKMPLETAQMLCSVWHRYNLGYLVTYKEAYKNHPCTRWAGDSKENYRWLVKHGMELCREYTKRYGKIHKCQSLLVFFNHTRPAFILDDDETPQPQCMPDEYKVDNDVVLAYKYYYVGAKALIAKWNKTRSMPTWFERRMINE